MFTSIPNSDYRVRLLRGREAVLEQAPLLHELAGRCQPGAMNWLSYFFWTADFQSKVPYVVLLLKGEPETLFAAVLLFEYRPLGLPTRVFSTGDSSGFRTVVSMPDDRHAAAAAAVNALMGVGAAIVMLSYKAEATKRAPALTEGLQLRWTRQERPDGNTLKLAATYGETLATLGKSTRFNLGYYRRSLLRKMPIEFVADARGMLTEAEIMALNTGSLNPVSPQLFRLRYASACRLPGGFLLGIRSGGRWLSLIGGWRQGGVTVLHWQMNTAGMEKTSLGTVMRSYFLEHEVERGAHSVTIYGGTPHSLRHSFVPFSVTDLIVRRRGWQAMALRGFAWLIAERQERAGRANVLIGTLVRHGLEWHTTPVDLDMSITEHENHSPTK